MNERHYVLIDLFKNCEKYGGKSLLLTMNPICCQCNMVLVTVRASVERL